MKVKLKFPIIKNIALFVIAIFGSLYLAETIASLFFDKLEYSKRVLPATYVSDNETGYAYKSNTQTQLQILNGPATKITIGNIQQRCNSQVFCSWSEASTSAFGDSYTFGWGVDDGATWPALYEKLSGVSVTNFGVGGYNLEKTHLNIKKRNKSGFLAKNIIIGISYNDLEEGSDVYDKQVINGFLVRSGTEHLIAIRDNPIINSTHIGALLFKALTPISNQENEDLIENSHQSLKSLISSSILAERDVVFLFFNTPSHIKQIADNNFSNEELRTFYPKNYESLEKLAFKHGFNLIDTTKLLVNAYQKKPEHNHLFVENDNHYNYRANMLIAKHLNELLKL